MSGEQLASASADHAPRNLSAIAVLDLLSDPDAPVAGLLAEGRDATPLSGGPLGLVHFDVQGWYGQAAHNEDLISINDDLRGSGEPPVRNRARDPGRRVVGRRWLAPVAPVLSIK